MKKIINYLIVTAVITTIITACSVDDYSQLGYLTDKTVIVDEPTARAVLNGIYNKTRANINGMNKISLALSLVGVEQKPTPDNQSGIAFFNNNVKPAPVNERGNPLFLFYLKTYGGINLANLFLKKLEGGIKGLDKKLANQMMAEARVLRANLYFSLLRVFGQFYNSNSPYGIIATTQVVDGFTKLKRSSVSEVYDLIISDLKFGIKYAPLKQKGSGNNDDGGGMGDYGDGGDGDGGDGDGDGGDGD